MHPLRSWPIVIACVVFVLGLSFISGYHQGQQQIEATQVEPMAANISALQDRLNTQQRARQQQLADIQNRLSQQQQNSSQSRSILVELEQALLDLNADHAELINAYQELETQFLAREALIQQWLANPDAPTP